MRGISRKKRRARMEAWLKTPAGKEYVRRFRERTPEEAAEIERILKERALLKE